MARAAAKTGAMPAVIVAIEQRFPKDQRIIADDLAYAMLPFGMKAFVWLMRPAFARDWMVRATEKAAPGIWALMACRKRYIDEKLIEAVDEIDAVVNLGAGFDTRVYRLPTLADVPVWEIDQPENIAPKRLRLRRLLGAIPPHVNLVPIDFDRQDLGAVLTAHGYSAAARTFFIWEGVTQYLTQAGLVATFEFLARAARGSRLTFTYVRKDFIDGKATHGHEDLYKRLVVKGVWLSGMEPDHVEPFLDPFGWRVIEHIGYQELVDRYVKPTGRELAFTPVERIVYAEKL